MSTSIRVYFIQGTFNPMSQWHMAFMSQRAKKTSLVMKCNEEITVNLHLIQVRHEMTENGEMKFSLICPCIHPLKAASQCHVCVGLHDDQFLRLLSMNLWVLKCVRNDFSVSTDPLRLQMSRFGNFLFLLALSLLAWPWSAYWLGVD